MSQDIITIDILPVEIIFQIFLYLEPGNFLLVDRVCFLWSELSRDENLLKRVNPSKFIQIHPEVSSSPKEVVWNDFLYTESWVSLYPGIEKFLDIFHCLARAIEQKHTIAVKYFLSRIRKDITLDKPYILDVGEFATLFDLLADYWKPEVFTLLLKKYLLLYRQYFHISLFEKLKKEDYEPYLIGYPKPLNSTRGQKMFKRVPLVQFTNLAIQSDPNLAMQSGRKDNLSKRKREEFAPETLENTSLEIRSMIGMLDCVIY